MSIFLPSTATSLETAAGAAISANENDAGFWKRIAAAAEDLAGATTTANDTIGGYMLRSALALESIAGTTGAEENVNESGYLKRIVDALEVQSGAVVTGSLEHRMMIGAQNATFGGGGLGTELVTNGGFDDTSAWTVDNFSGNTMISGGLLYISDPADDGDAVYQAVAVTVGHTYRVAYEITARLGGGVRLNLGGATGTLRNAVGAYEEDLVIVSGTDLAFSLALPNSIQIDNVSVREVL